MYIEGITKLDPIDFEFADRFGYVIKPLAVAEEHEDGVEVRVHPTMIPKSWMLATVDGAKNALYVKSYALGPSLYYGAGAGMMPTAVAAVSDVIEVSRNVLAGGAGHLPMRAYESMANRPIRDIGALRSRYYMRFGVLDRPGVLGQLTAVLGDHQISIAQVVQEGPRDAERPVLVVVLTHEARESNVQHALTQISKLASVVEPTRIVRIAE
jgi:homoserine dehydrogenase